MANQQMEQQVIAVLGIGVTGLSVARFLAKRDQPFVMADTRDEPPMLAQFQAEFANVPCYLGSDAEQALNGTSELVVSPGVAPTEPLVVAAKAQDVDVVGDIELFARSVTAPVVAITGSNGKSTVTELLGEMARKAGRNVAVGGNLGTPALELLDDQVELYVLELSSFQLELVESLQPAVAVILNVSEDHLDRYPSINEYRAAKQRIFRGAKHVVVNRDDAATELVGAVASVSGFGLAVPAVNDFGLVEQHGESWLASPIGTLMPVSELRVKGGHNCANALAALALGSAVELPLAAMLAALREFSGLRHRCQTVRELNGVTYINDSKATNVGAALAALQGLANRKAANIVWIAGGESKGADFSELADVVAQAAKQVILIGRDAEQIAQVLPVQALRCESLQQAVSEAAKVAEAGDLVLLSPACASFDMFRNFEVRGDAFIEAVDALPKSGEADA